MWVPQQQDSNLIKKQRKKDFTLKTIKLQIMSKIYLIQKNKLFKQAILDYVHLFFFYVIVYLSCTTINTLCWAYLIPVLHSYV